VPEFNNPAVREIFIKKYRLIYKIEKKIVYIIGIIHGARDLSTLWEQGERNNF